MAKAPAGWPDPSAIRGFRLVYPAAQSADLDRIGVAIADSFEPFPTAAALRDGARRFVRADAGVRAVPPGIRGDRTSRRAGPGAERHRRGRLPQSDDRWKAGEIHCAKIGTLA